MGECRGSDRSIHVIADDREPCAAVPEALRRHPGFSIDTMRLDRGDYLVDSRYLFERKTLTDFVVSIESGRLFAQALRLVEAPGVRPALVLEGTAAQLRRCRMRREAIRGALVTLSMFIGLPVLRTRSAEETVETFRYVAEQGRAVAQGALPRRGRRPKGRAAYQNHLLQGLPGVGPERARRLLAHFGSVRAVMAADRSELAAVPGIGARIARRIEWAVEEAPAGYAHPGGTPRVSDRVRNDHLGLAARLEIPRIAGRDRQPVLNGDRGLDGVRQFPALASPQPGRGVGRLDGDGQRCEDVEQIQGERGRALVEAGECLGAGDDGQGGLAAVLGEEGSGCLDTVEVVDHDDRIEQKPHGWSSHSPRIRC